MQLLRYKTLLLFVGVLVVALAVQAMLWLSFPVADQNYWAADAAKVAAGHPLGPSDITYPHPGTTIIYPTAALIRAGLGGKVALRLVMAVLIALCATLAALLAYRLYPGSWWWLAVALILIPDMRFLHGTPPSSAAAALTVLYFLLVWYAARAGTQLRPLIFVGACAGVLLATRIDTGLFVLCTALPFLLLTARWRVFVPPAVAALTFFICNPYMWAAPLAYLQSIPAIIASNEALVGIHILVPFLSTFPFAIGSLILSAVAMFLLYRTSADTRMPLPVYLWFLGATLLYTALLAPLQYHPVRYFLPFYMVWDILLPYWLYTLAARYGSRVPYLTPRQIEIAVIVCIALLIPLRLYLLMTADTMEIIL